jgi:hypothetical protein
MTGPDKTTETRLRQMFSDAAVQIHPTRPVPDIGGSPSPASRRARLGVTIGLSVCVVAAAAIALDVHAWGGSGRLEPAGTTTIAGQLLVVKSNGAVELVSPNTGAVIRRLVGSSPVASNGLHLRRPTAVTTAGHVAYVSYMGPTPVIVSIPFTGGTPRFVVYGTAPAASPDGTKLAYFEGTAGALSSGVIDVRDLATGKTRTVYATSPDTIPATLSWSADDRRLAISGLFLPATSLIDDWGLDVEVLDLVRPFEPTVAFPRPLPANPAVVGTETTLASGHPTWTDGQFLGNGIKLAILSTGAGTTCHAAPTRILSVDPDNGQATTIAALPFPISHAFFDKTGHLVAVERTLAPASCRTTPDTTTTTTTPTVSPMQIGPGVTNSPRISGSFSVVPTQSVLDRWSDGKTSRLVGGVAAVAFVTGRS